MRGTHDGFMHGGFRIVQNSLMDKINYKTVNRTWKERLFTRPWNPLKKQKIEVISVPSDEVIVDELNNVIYMHTKTFKEFMEQFDELERDLPYGFSRKSSKQ